MQSFTCLNKTSKNRTILPDLTTNFFGLSRQCSKEIIPILLVQFVQEEAAKVKNKKERK